MRLGEPNIGVVLRLLRQLGARRRRQFFLLLVLMLLTSVAEVVSIGAVMPFLAALTYPDRVFLHPFAAPVVAFLHLTSPGQLVLPITLAFCFAAFVAGAARIALLWSSTRFSYAVGSELSSQVYRHALHQPYAVHCARDSSELISAITTKSHLAIGAISNLLTLMASGVIVVVIVGVLVSIEPIVALTTALVFGCLYVVITRVSRQGLRANSQIAACESSRVVKTLQEGLGGIRDILIDGSQATYCEIYRSADYALRRAQGGHTFISASPRYVMEVLGMILIAALAGMLAQRDTGIQDAIPILGALAMGAQRLLPTLQSIYAAWSGIEGHKASLLDYLELLEQKEGLSTQLESQVSLQFDRSVTLKNVGFRYAPGMPYVLENLTLEIQKGSRIGFIGVTGGGKSTLLDVIMGLLEPSQGQIEVDGRSVSLFGNRGWQARIAHVPQAIFLTDSSIEENIAFGIPKDKIDRERVLRASRQAQISSYIESLPDQYDTAVGERGIQLSGGQRQRIGIARALYKDAQVLVFDEATSALDGETEQAVMQVIEGLGPSYTLLIIAHRLSTLRTCTQIVELGDRGIKRIGTYREMIHPGGVQAVNSES